MPIRIKLFLLLYLVVLAIFMAGSRLPPDSYYYWAWSHHLALSYYDGPPLIAYVIKLSTQLFGQHEFSIYLVGLITSAITSVLIYRLTKQLFDRSAAEMAFYLWLLTVGATLFFTIKVSYNSVLIIFWALTLYFFVQLQRSKKRYYYYLCGVTVGLMMLSKYNGIFLVISLFLVCLFDKRYRFILINPHSYVAMLLALAIFSPVIIWNVQHHWVSLHFQLYHGFAMHRISPLQTVIFYIAINMFKWNFVFIALCYFLAHDYRQVIRNSGLRLLFIPTAFVWLFFLVSSLFSLPEPNWNAPFSFTAIMLVGYFMSRPQIARWVRRLLLLGLASITLLMLILMRFTLHLPPVLYWWGYSWGMYEIVSQLPPAISQSKLPIVTASDYQLPACLSAFLPNKRGQIFGLTPATHQYYYWWQQSRPTLDTEAVLYFSRTAATTFPSPLKSCQLLHWQQYYHKRERERYAWQLYVYHCTL